MDRHSAGGAAHATSSAAGAHSSSRSGAGGSGSSSKRNGASSSSSHRHHQHQHHQHAQQQPQAGSARGYGHPSREAMTAAEAHQLRLYQQQQQQHQQQAFVHHHQQAQYHNPLAGPSSTSMPYGGSSAGAGAPGTAAVGIAAPGVASGSALPPPQFGPTAHESKKDKKRKEVVDRIYRVHWDTFDEREAMYQEQYQSLTETYGTLINTPLQHRPYLLALANLALERDQQLRETALFSLHQIESVRNANAAERSKVEDEARLQKKHVRETLLNAVEERRKRLREEKEGGNEFAVELALDNAMRSGSIRKLRNKGGLGGSRGRNALDDDDGGEGGGGGTGGNGSGGGHGSNGAGGSNGQHGSANGDRSSSRSGAGNASSLLSADGFGSFLSAGGAANLSTAGAILAASANAAAAAAGGSSSAGGSGSGSGSGSGGTGGSGSGNGNNGGGSAHTGQARAIQVNLPSGFQLSLGPNGGLEMVTTSSAKAAKYDIGKSLFGLTAAKDFEIEADMFSIRKTGGKRRRR